MSTHLFFPGQRIEYRALNICVTRVALEADLDADVLWGPGWPAAKVGLIQVPIETIYLWIYGTKEWTIGASSYGFIPLTPPQTFPANHGYVEFEHYGADTFYRSWNSLVWPELESGEADVGAGVMMREAPPAIKLGRWATPCYATLLLNNDGGSSYAALTIPAQIYYVEESGAYWFQLDYEEGIGQAFTDPSGRLATTAVAGTIMFQGHSVTAYGLLTGYACSITGSPR